MVIFEFQTKFCGFQTLFFEFIHRNLKIMLWISLIVYFNFEHYSLTFKEKSLKFKDKSLEI